MANKPGYKNTELGWIPDQWEVRELKTLGTFLKGKGISREEIRVIGLPCIRYGEIYTTYNNYFSNALSFIEEASALESQLVNQNDLLFSGSGESAEEIGKCVAYLGNQNIYAGSDIIILRPDSGDSKYLSFILNHKTSIKQKSVLGQGHSVVHIYPHSLGQVKITLPPLPEQKKIAEILSTWDKAIESTEKLIEVKTKLKQGLMQKLLTGKMRFKEFKDEKWEKVKIRKCAKQIIKKNSKNINYVVLSCTKYHGLVNSLTYFGRQMFSNDLSTYKVVENGQFAYATNHIEEGSIGYQNIYDFALISPMYTVFETNEEIDDTFLYPVLKTEQYRKIFENNTSGSINRRGGLRWDDFSNIIIPKPSIKEQQKIANTLYKLDKEIEILIKQLEALKEQKKGLMQKLLTGEVRVKADE